MKILVDNQLPLALARHIEGSLGVPCLHVCDVGLDHASDHEVWKYAISSGSVIVSKDEDFLHLSIADLNGPPLIWVRMGNCRKPVLLAAFDRCWPDMVAELNSGSKIIEVR